MPRIKNAIRSQSINVLSARLFAEGIVKLKKLIKKLTSTTTAERHRIEEGIADWATRDFLDNSPQFIKEKVFLKHGVAAAPWVETGTYQGDTTRFLLGYFPKVYTIEPEPTLYKNACDLFKGQPVELFNDISENVLPELLPKLSGNLNFWLDGHYSAGTTFKGPKDCPVEDELAAIAANLSNFNKLAILIDDIRFLVGNADDWTEKPSIDYLVDWARAHKFYWRIEHDIFIIKNH